MIHIFWGTNVKIFQKSDILNGTFLYYFPAVLSIIFCFSLSCQIRKQQIKNTEPFSLIQCSRSACTSCFITYWKFQKASVSNIMTPTCMNMIWSERRVWEIFDACSIIQLITTTFSHLLGMLYLLCMMLYSLSQGLDLQLMKMKSQNLKNVKSKIILWNKTSQDRVNKEKRI